MKIQARNIVVHGRVQGVGFRYFVQRVGKRMGLGGNVSNRPDGTVEIVIEGNPNQIDEFIREVRRGPPMGHVDRLEAHNVAATGKYSSFLIEGW